ncbi:uncharacterized protein LOC144133590 isoform X2 [Amblyomma americanum]
MYESYMTTIICVIMVVFSIACIVVIIFISFSHSKHEKAAQKKRRAATDVIGEEPSDTDRDEVAALSRPPACSQPMYFRCLNNSDYGRGEWVFVLRDHGQSGSCRRWQPDSVCARDSPAHFRKRQDCVRTCEGLIDRYVYGEERLGHQTQLGASAPSRWSRGRCQHHDRDAGRGLRTPLAPRDHSATGVSRGAGVPQVPGERDPPSDAASRGVAGGRPPEEGAPALVLPARSFRLPRVDAGDSLPARLQGALRQPRGVPGRLRRSHQIEEEDREEAAMEGDCALPKKEKQPVYHLVWGALRRMKESQSWARIGSLLREEKMGHERPSETPVSFLICMAASAFLATLLLVASMAYFRQRYSQPVCSAPRFRKCDAPQEQPKPHWRERPSLQWYYLNTSFGQHCLQWSADTLPCLNGSRLHFASLEECRQECETAVPGRWCDATVYEGMVDCGLKRTGGEAVVNGSLWWYYDVLLGSCHDWTDICIEPWKNSLDQCAADCLLM